MYCCALIVNTCVLYLNSEYVCCGIMVCVLVVSVLLCFNSVDQEIFNMLFNFHQHREMTKIKLHGN